MGKPAVTVVTFGKPDGFREIHIGHLSGVVLHADVYARARKAQGETVFLVSGTDGYGAAVYQHAREACGRTPGEAELRAYVREFHEKQRRTLAAYQVGLDYYGNDTDPETSRALEQLCRRVRMRLEEQGTCSRRRERYAVDPVYGCPLGNHQIRESREDGREVRRSRLTGQEVYWEEGDNLFLSLEAYREVIRASLSRYGDRGGDGFIRAYVERMLQGPLPEYRLTSHQPWALPAEDGLRCQVWFASLLAPVYYGRKAAEKAGTAWKPDQMRFVQFISEDTLFFYAVLQPVLWQALDPEWPLPELHCNRTRTFADESGTPCFCSGDELLQRFSAGQIRVCFTARGTGRTKIALTGEEMERLWGGYRQAKRRSASAAGSFSGRESEAVSAQYFRLLEQREFSKAADLADRFYRKSREIRTEMMKAVVPVWSAGCERRQEREDENL